MAGPFQQTFVVADTRIHNQITDTEQPRQNTQPKPPAGQRIVVFGNAVPLMTRSLYFFATSSDV